MEKHPLHLKIPDLQQSDEVFDAVEKQERLTGEDLPNDPNERLDAYMDRLEKIFLNSDERVRERNLEMLRPAIYDAFLIKPEQVPESYFELQQQVAREIGQTVEVISPEVRAEMIQTVIADQKHSLDQWIDYLTNPNDAVYPTWFKYYVFRNIIKLSQFDKTLGRFKDRTPTTVAPYPDVYRAPLAKILDIYEQGTKDNISFTKKFPKLYAELISESLAVRIENKEQIKGKWIKYKQNNPKDAQALYDSVQAKGTGWCVEGKSTADNYNKMGDFYIFYTENQDGKAIQPRIAIQMTGDKIGQIRGVLTRQEVEPLLQDVLDEKLKEFGPEADTYKKKSADMKRMTDIEKKTKAQEPLIKDDLLFLYEVNSTIESFGYDKDPRIAEVRKSRDLKEDLPIIFDCQSDQIATDSTELTKKTVAYVGPWNPTVMQQIPTTVQHIYESFPDKKVFLKTIETDPEITSAKTAIAKLKAEGHTTNDYIDDLLTKVDWQEKLKSSYEVVSFSVSELFGDQNVHTYTEIKVKAQELGLDLIPQALAPSICLNYPKNGAWTVMAMNAIRDRDGAPRLFDCSGNGAESWLDHDDGHAGGRWHPRNRFFFVRK